MKNVVPEFEVPSPVQKPVEDKGTTMQPLQHEEKGVQEEPLATDNVSVVERQPDDMKQSINPENNAVLCSQNSTLSTGELQLPIKSTVQGIPEPVQLGTQSSGEYEQVQQLKCDILPKPELLPVSQKPRHTGDLAVECVSAPRGKASTMADAAEEEVADPQPQHTRPASNTEEDDDTGRLGEEVIQDVAQHTTLDRRYGAYDVEDTPRNRASGIQEEDEYMRIIAQQQTILQQQKLIESLIQHRYNSMQSSGSPESAGQSYRYVAINRLLGKGASGRERPTKIPNVAEPANLERSGSSIHVEDLQGGTRGAEQRRQGDAGYQQRLRQRYGDMDGFLAYKKLHCTREQGVGPRVVPNLDQRSRYAQELTERQREQLRGKAMRQRPQTPVLKIDLSNLLRSRERRPDNVFTAGGPSERPQQGARVVKLDLNDAHSSQGAVAARSQGFQPGRCSVIQKKAYLSTNLKAASQRPRTPQYAARSRPQHPMKASAQ